jgi:SAM-dependent methyltransferase
VSLEQTLLAIANSDIERAVALALEVHEAPTPSLLAPALVGYLTAALQDGVYDEPTAFAEFIDNGTNPSLYALTIEMVGARHRELHPTSVLDIGCGDGRVTRTVLQSDVATIDLVDPSAELLSLAAKSVEIPGRWVGAHNLSLSDFLDGLDSDERWQLAQSTFALHSLEPNERRAALEYLRPRVDRLLIVEFDVPAYTDRTIEHARYAVARYETGVAEYADHPRVITGFLMPVLVGQFNPEHPRLTFEQPIASWTDDLHRAGFESVERKAVANYWWAPAVMIEAF